MTEVTCGCEHMWPSGIDRSSCYWHSDATATTTKTTPDEDRRAS